jgi:hypothetical protein
MGRNLGHPRGNNAASTGKSWKIGTELEEWLKASHECDEKLGMQFSLQQ